ncbi:hypothetical protein Fmac_018680 [Flemingia macrophylla]|uniref:Cysteine-rich transmembrane CYSTM domain-containing protein n=1 Tax=Flemingia macrophylla TaxID=520843 RepID=A0ABD1M5Q1_9FABA
MDHQQQAPVSAYPAVNERNRTCTAAAPPVGYPTKDDVPSQQAVPIKTTSKGGGFWLECCEVCRKCMCCALECVASS